MASLYLLVQNLFDPRARATGFRTEVQYNRVEEGYAAEMVKNDYFFLGGINTIFDMKIENKFPRRRLPMVCKTNYVT